MVQQLSLDPFLMLAALRKVVGAAGEKQGAAQGNAGKAQ